MRKIEINDKAKKIIAWIMLVIMGIFSAIGILTCLGGIYSCATKNKAEVKRVYAAEETQAVNFTLLGISFIDSGEPYQQDGRITIQIATEGIIINAFNYAQTTESEKPQIEYKGLDTKGQPYWIIRNIQMLTRRYNGATDKVEWMPVFDYNFTLTLKSGYKINSTQVTLEEMPKEARMSGTPTQPDATTVIPYEIEMVGQNGIIAVFELSINQFDSATMSYMPIYNYKLTGSGDLGYQQAYERGYKEGNKNKEAYGQAQREAGKQEGIAQANDYSFTSLISAVFDVPIQTLFGMLNFNILGVNVLTFITSILSIMLLVFIIKLILGG